MIASVLLATALIWLLVGALICIGTLRHKHTWEGWEKGIKVKTTTGHKQREYNTCRGCGATRIRSVSW